MGYNVVTNNVSPAADITSWVDTYKEAHIGASHDQSMLNLATPDDSLLVVGPPRLKDAGGSSDSFYLVGMVQGLNYSESSAVQPMKTIGSRRHVFAKSNQPVQGSISRMLVLGSNLYRALYALTDIPDNIASRNAQFAVGDKDKASFYTNLEDDLFRLPFGLGIIYQSPSTAAEKGKTTVGAEYLEICTLVNRQAQMATGQGMILESVSFMADRVVPWTAYAGPEWDSDNPAASLLS